MPPYKHRIYDEFSAFEFENEQSLSLPLENVKKPKLGRSGRKKKKKKKNANGHRPKGYHQYGIFDNGPDAEDDVDDDHEEEDEEEEGDSDRDQAGRTKMSKKRAALIERLSKKTSRRANKKPDLSRGILAFDKDLYTYSMPYVHTCPGTVY